MPGTTARIPMNHRILTCNGVEIGDSEDPAMSLSDTVFGFLDEDGGGMLSESSSSGGDYYGDNEGGDEEEDDDDEREKPASLEDNRSFWENQRQLLQATLCRSSSLESKIRQATKEAIREAKMAGSICDCRKPVAGECRNCLMREICGRVQNAGFNCAICKSKWRSSRDIPSGKHTFMDVVDNSIPKRGGVRVIIEPNFRAEFEIARAGEEYNRLIAMLPEVFVGKIERLSSLIKILCLAGKKCMRDKKMHMGPWRKQKYMQAKWIRGCQRMTPAPAELPAGASGGYSPPSPRKPRASMLTIDLSENFHGLHRQVVAVV